MSMLEEMVGIAALVFVLAGADAGAATMPACIAVATEARYVPYGYNHVVQLRNGCSKPATCTVSTNVNPQAQTVEVPASRAVEVTTFIGSPARTFVPHVSCTLAK